ncbi:tryptophan synthase, alpha subunit [Streptomyces viridochromogenes DSM 40736]|uniref:Tryptophan synthase alpha chain n=1 Tax=Streptomyces viridochromogenes (strain DSM 40736 / JCM 4977 / BCRC 1201 / Tue 494) TaxID=591159 RepID=D9X1T1_STRVT|nr:tryptophan synthase subunit alpha [Streptomyces viridochromogenes]EFL29503.1 tryptophan synthase, alpha subunit [Streptomyces viridochromogenes DSM 40736]
MPPSWAAARLDYALATSRSEQRAALGLYLPVGYPSRTASLDALHRMAQHADVLELGLPHSDPHMDGPVIQQSSAQALDRGFEMIHLFEAATELTASSTTALVVMSYWDPIARFGPELFADRLCVAGVGAVLIPDLPEHATATWQSAAREAGLHAIPLVPAHASNARLAAIGATSSGMVYAPATPGRTGAQRPLSPYLPRLVRRLRTATRLPVAVGIGISTPEHAAQASAYADAVVVGSAVIRHMQARPDAPAEAAADTARAFAGGVRRASNPLS